MKNKASLRQLAKQLGVSTSYLSQVKNGKRPPSQNLLSNPSFEMLSRVLSDEGVFTAEGGTRTHTPLQEADFKSAASTIPPPRPDN
jgi:transcriptional regulator with XRE-family HTH domain